MVRTGVLRAYGAAIRRRLGASMENRFAALAAGLGATLLLQSSTATALMAASFVGRGLVGAGGALAIMLGADIGTSLVAQALTLDIHWLSPLLIVAGLVSFMSGRGTRLQDIGRVVVGLGFDAAGAEPARRGGPTDPRGGRNPAAHIVARRRADPGGAGRRAAGHALGLQPRRRAPGDLIRGRGGDPLPLAFALVLGANLGGGITPVLAMLGGEPAARRVPLGNLMFRAVGVAAALPFVDQFAATLSLIETGPARQIANLHTAFNLALAVVFLPLVGLAAKATARLIPDRPEPDDAARPRYLDAAAIDTPSVAIASAARETLRLGDIVATMLREALEVFRADDRRLLREVERSDDVDRPAAGGHQALSDAGQPRGARS